MVWCRSDRGAVLVPPSAGADVKPRPFWTGSMALNLITLTEVGTREKVDVNLAAIATVRASESGSLITLLDGQRLAVSDSQDQVRKRANLRPVDGFG